MKNKSALANLLMLAGAVIWGAAFVAQNIGSDYLGPFAFGGIRFLLGAVVIIPIYLADKKKNPPANDAPLPQYLKSGIICGVAIFLGATLQQWGIMHTTSGKAGFVTALYMILVPVFGYFIYKTRISSRVAVAACLAVVGIFLLCVDSGFSVNKGDIIVFAGAVCWAFQILLIDRLAKDLNGFKFSIIEFLTCSFISLFLMFIFERPSFDAVFSAAVPLLYCGILSVGVGFTAQVICLKYTDPTVASLIMSTESVFAAVFGFLLLDEKLALKQLAGCVLVFLAVVLTQINPKKKSDNVLTVACDTEYNNSKDSQ